MIILKGEGGENILIEIKGEVYPTANDESDRDFLKAFIKADVTGLALRLIL